MSERSGVLDLNWPRGQHIGIKREEASISRPFAAGHVALSATVPCFVSIGRSRNPATVPTLYLHPGPPVVVAIGDEHSVIVTPRGETGVLTVVPLAADKKPARA